MRKEGPIHDNRYNEGQIILADDEITERTKMKRRIKDLGQQHKFIALSDGYSLIDYVENALSAIISTHAEGK